MPVVLLDHGNTGTQVSCQCAHGHSVIGLRHVGVVVAQAIHSALLADSGIVKQI